MFESLADIKLFRDLSPEQVAQLCNGRATTRAFARGDVVATQGSRCSALMLLTEGRLEAETTGRRGERLSSEMLSAPTLVAPAFLFAANPTLPATLTARTPATLVTIPREEFTGMMQQDATVLRNFLEILSSPDKLVSDRTLYLTCKTIKGKVARYLLELAGDENRTEVRNPLTQREMADLFGVTRPALARALGEMSAEGSIFVRGKEISILFTEKLRQYIR